MSNKKLHENLYLKIVFEDDHDAFNELFFEFYPALCVFAGRYISSPEACEDIVQEVFYNIWKNRKILNIHSSFRNFLVTSVRNSCTDYLRKKSSHKKYLENLTPAYSTETPGQVYTIKELEEMIQIALEKLPENIQLAFNMSRTEKMTYNEIATEMNLSVKTIESYMSQALKMLREKLKDYLPIALLLTSFIS